MQLGRQGVEVDLVAEAGVERLDRAGGVVAAPVEAPVHGLLDAAADRLEQGGHRQGGGGHCQARGALPDRAQQLAEGENEAAITEAKHDGEVA